MSDDSVRIQLRAPQVMTLLDGLGDGLLTRVAERLAAARPDGLHGVPPSELHARIHELAATFCRRYGVRVSRDVVRVIGLAVRHGWDLDEGDRGAWVREILLDARTPTVSRRVERLVEESRRRDSIEARNRQIDAQLEHDRP